MKILHAPIEIAGQIGILCGALNRFGHHAKGYNFFRTYLGYEENLMNIDLFELGKISGEAIDYFDLFHFHYGLSLLANFKDLEWIAGTGKPVVMHHWGNDVRKASIARQHNPYVYTGDSPPEADIDKTLKQIGRHVSTAIVQDYEVLPYVKPYYKEVVVLPLAIDLEKFWPAYPDKTAKDPLVVHAPTNPDFKGTEVVERVIQQLQREIGFRYKRIEKQHHEHVISLYREADIIIDQILCGSYGLLSVEAMSLGKPVVVYIREDLLKTFDTPPPVANANPDTLYDVLKELLLSPELRYSRGLAGRAFVETFHDRVIVGRQLLRLYERLLHESGLQP